MSIQGSPTRSVQPEVMEHDLLILGTGAAAPTVATPPGPTGITVSRVSAGVTKLTWGENPGRFINMFFGLRATTPGDLKTFTIVREAYNSTTRSIQFTLYNASGTATDLAALQWMDILVRFKSTAV